LYNPNLAVHLVDHLPSLAAAQHFLPQGHLAVSAADGQDVTGQRPRDPPDGVRELGRLIGAVGTERGRFPGRRWVGSVVNQHGSVLYDALALERDRVDWTHLRRRGNVLSRKADIRSPRHIPHPIRMAVQLFLELGLGFIVPTTRSARAPFDANDVPVRPYPHHGVTSARRQSFLVSHSVLAFYRGDLLAAGRGVVAQGSGHVGRGPGDGVYTNRVRLELFAVRRAVVCATLAVIDTRAWTLTLELQDRHVAVARCASQDRTEFIRCPRDRVDCSRISTGDF
jgi:hypothetical protein